MVMFSPYSIGMVSLLSFSVFESLFACLFLTDIFFIHRLIAHLSLLIYELLWVPTMNRANLYCLKFTFFLVPCYWVRVYRSLSNMVWSDDSRTYFSWLCSWVMSCVASSDSLVCSGKFQILEVNFALFLDQKKMSS